MLLSNVCMLAGVLSYGITEQCGRSVYYLEEVNNNRANDFPFSPETEADYGV